MFLRFIFFIRLNENIDFQLSKYAIIGDEAIEYVTIEETILEYLDHLSHLLMKGSIIVIITIHNNETNFTFSNENTCT